jgi:hypothetical protein
MTIARLSGWLSGVGVRFRPVCLASAGSLRVSGHTRQGRRLMRRPMRAVRACRQASDVPGAAPERAAAEIVACRCDVPVWPRDREDEIRPCWSPARAAASRQNVRSGWRESTRSPRLWSSKLSLPSPYRCCRGHGVGSGTCGQPGSLPAAVAGSMTRSDARSH